MRKIYILYLAALVSLASCGNNIPVQKDLFPEIPKFPEFKDKVLTSKKISSIKLRMDTSFKRPENTYYFNYLVRDSAIYFITYFSDTEFPKIPINDEYIVDLVVVKNNQPVQHYNWKINNFQLNFDVDQQHNVIIGKRKYLAGKNYLKYDEINAPRTDSEKTLSIFTEWQSQKQDEIEETDYLSAFDRVIIGSRGSLFGNRNSGDIIHHSAVYLIYYKLKYKHKEARTKFDDRYENAPLFIKLNEELYFVNYDEKEGSDGVEFKEYTINKIEE